MVVLQQLAIFCKKGYLTRSCYIFAKASYFERYCNIFVKKWLSSKILQYICKNGYLATACNVLLKKMLSCKILQKFCLKNGFLARSCLIFAKKVFLQDFKLCFDKNGYLSRTFNKIFHLGRFRNNHARVEFRRNINFCKISASLPFLNFPSRRLPIVFFFNIKSNKEAR